MVATQINQHYTHVKIMQQDVITTRHNVEFVLGLFFYTITMLLGKASVRERTDIVDASLHWLWANVFY